ncbi:hypothetical protein N5876_32790 (plasmid) [Pseudomonas aeruginosa]|uniref:hypothetical protein n=1 Tax=Pseudomonas aeruginosa TaxID=287 RepID=UPI0021BE737C|nr:hypothetical protein [Pseudomonas aeruginosa]UXH55927.1 hypothetical protein N5876_32790 [Pseudomonas aeruginosa]UXH68971.1 hypothetical protein N5879_32915 [Pseudomonas aeruginosa]
MSHVLARALTLSATHFVDGQLLNYDADEVYPRLKTLSSEGNCLLASEVRDFPINPDYRNLTVTELVERIEQTADQMVAFANLIALRGRPRTSSAGKDSAGREAVL